MGWFVNSQVAFLDQSLLTLPLNSLLSAGFITYLAAASEDARLETVERWKKYVGLEDYSFTNFMSKESEMLVWKAEGLPSDGLSMENAIVILNSTQVPYIIQHQNPNPNPNPIVHNKTWILSGILSGICRK